MIRIKPTSSDEKYQVITPTIFPDGTSQVWRIELVKNTSYTIKWNFENESELMHVLQLRDLIKYTNPKYFIYLDVPYLPYGRQDKDISTNNTFALHTFLDILSSNFYVVHTYDAHNPKMLGQWHYVSKRATHVIDILKITKPAVKLINEYYTPTTEGPIGLSVPASEHSVMTSYGQENELDAFKHMLKTYPTGIVSIVSDSFNLWNVLNNFTEELRSEIENRDGKVVFRPDSGNPEYIICGDPSAPVGSSENKGALRILDEKFGHTVNSKGYKEINSKVGLIYGDGMYFERYERILNNLKEMGYANTNLVIGVGGLLLQQHSRDDQGFAFKATYCEINGVPREIVKDPITDPGKKSHKGLLALQKDGLGYFTLDQVDKFTEQNDNLLNVVYKNGVLLKEYSIEQIRARANG